VWLSNDQMQPAAFTQCSVMSALGQKRTSALQKVMSALPPKADMCIATAYVRYANSGALAVLRLTINSNFVGCSIGNSAGFAPFRIRAT